MHCRGQAQISPEMAADNWPSDGKGVLPCSARHAPALVRGFTPDNAGDVNAGGQALWFEARFPGANYLWQLRVLSQRSVPLVRISGAGTLTYLQNEIPTVSALPVIQKLKLLLYLAKGPAALSAAK